ncbi:MAG: carboxy terminal-processing peptidase [Spirochaetia bacterium]|jgi:carboxyl-terminal processing protease|nr:carboxy terminal-processing peptidase [Spirochaetia bacterium]
MNKKVIPFLVLLVAFSCFSKQEGLKESEMVGLMNRFLSMHVQYKSFDDELSERTMNNYIMILDYGKYYFYKSDIDSFNEHKTLLDDYIKDDDYHVIIDIYDVFKKRFGETMSIIDELLKAPYDFQIDEEIITDRDLVEYASNTTEMKERWRKSIKLQLLNYISAGKDIGYARNKLKKKFELLKKRTDEITRSDIFTKFINAWTMALDPHSNYLTQDENDDFRISMELKLEGIGVRLRSEDGFVLVDSIITGGASDKLPAQLQLKPNDKIVAVSQDNDDWTDVIDMDLKDVVKLIRGKKGTTVYLTIMRDADESGKPNRMAVPIKREEIKLQDSEAKYQIQVFGTGKNAVKIGYINLPSFYMDSTGSKSSSGDMKNIFLSLSKENIQGLILDLRGNPGGLLNEAIEIAGLFIDNGPVVQIKDAAHSPVVYNDNDFGVSYSGPLVVLIDKFSASASEILAGAIKDYKRGLIVGSSNTFGKGTVQSYNELGGKRGAMKVTTHIFYQPSGTSNQLNGIVPDMTIPDMNSVWDIGENKSKYPLNWTPIPSARFIPVNRVTPAIAVRLQTLSKNRIDSDKEFKELQTKIDKFKKQISKKSISLKEESTMEKQREKELEKNRKESKQILDLENDLFLREAFNVTIDYIKITK